MLNELRGGTKKKASANVDKTVDTKAGPCTRTWRDYDGREKQEGDAWFQHVVNHVRQDDRKRDGADGARVAGKTRGRTERSVRSPHDAENDTLGR